MLYLDLDGVLLDFDTAHEQAFGYRPSTTGRKPAWERIATTPWFFRNAPFMADYRELWDGVAELGPTILTGIGKSMPGTLEQKRAWVDQYLGWEIPVIGCLAKDKSTYCKPGDILIDDRDEHADLWRAAGGRWITHVSAKESLRQLWMLLS